MNNEIKEIKINKANKSITFINNGIAFSQFGIADEILDLITNLQQRNNNLIEDFKRHVDRINELTERSDNLQQENERLKEYYDLMVQFNEKNLDRFCDYYSRCEKAIEYMQENYNELTDYGYKKEIYDDLLNILQNGSDDNV